MQTRNLRTWATMGYDTGGLIRHLRGSIRDPMRALNSAVVTGSVPDYLFAPTTLRALYRKGYLGLPRTIWSRPLWAPTKSYPITEAGRVAFSKGVL